MNSDKEYDRLADKEEDAYLLTEEVMTKLPGMVRFDDETNGCYIIVERIRFDLVPYTDDTEEIFLDN